MAHVITSKYADNAALYRFERMLARDGVDIARSTMCGRKRAALDMLASPVRRMEARIRNRGVIHTDDASVPVPDKGRGRARSSARVDRMQGLLGLQQ